LRRVPTSIKCPRCGFGYDDAESAASVERGDLKAETMCPHCSYVSPLRKLVVIRGVWREPSASRRVLGWVVGAGFIVAVFIIGSAIGWAYGAVHGALPALLAAALLVGELGFFIFMRVRKRRTREQRIS
jgi:hypothetical protein